MRAQDLDLNLLLVFDALFEERSVSRAARRLGLSQPTVSASLGRLRVNFNDQLFYKTSAGIEPTPRAATLRGPIASVLATIQQEVLLGAAFDPATTEREFRIVLGEIGETTLLPRLLQVLQARAPHARLTVLSASPPQIVELFDEGKIELASGHIPDLTSPVLNRELVFERPLVGLTGAHNRFPEPVTLERFCAMRYAATGTDAGYHEGCVEAIRRAGCELNVVLTVPRFVSLPCILSDSDLVTIVPKRMGDIYCRNGAMRQFDLPFKAPITDVNLYWHKRMQDDPANVWLRELTLSVFRQPYARAISVAAEAAAS